MANDALVLPASTRPGISALVQTYLDEQLFEAKLWGRNVSLQLFAAVNGFRSSYYGIGTPRVEGIDPRPDEMFIIGKDMGSERARSLSTVTSDTWQPLNKTREIENAVTQQTSFFGNNSMMNDWASNTLPQTLKRGVVKWVYSQLEVVVSNDEAYWLQLGNPTAKFNLVADTARDRQSRLMSKVDNDWHVSAGPASTSADYWSLPYSFKTICGTTGVVHGLDRDDATNAWNRGNTITQTSSSFHDMFMYDNYNTSGPQLDKFGYRVRYYLCNGDLYAKALTEAEARGTKPVTMDAIPELAGYGFTQTGAVSINNQCWVIHDPNMPANEVFGVNPTVWSVGFRKNFQMTALTDQSTIRGQPRIKSAQMEALYLGPYCHAPWANTYRTTVTG